MRRWHVDRRITLTLILAIIVQVMTAFMWAAQLDARVVSLEKENPDSQTIRENLVRLDERISAVRSDIGDLRGRIEILFRQKR